MSFFTRNALIALLITVAIIGTVLYAVNYLNQQRVAELRTIEDQLATDTLSIETQFALLEEAPCEDIAAGTTLSQEVGGVGDKLAYAEEHAGANDPDVLRLKERYTLLQIRDYLLTKRLSETCGFKPVVALYFYSNIPGECENCDRAGYALSYLRQTYPSLRVYSFDYHLDLAALRTLIAVLKVDSQFPAFVVQGKRTYGFTSLEDLEKAFPKSLFATSTASSTKPR
jgi:hypothetical protein